ncbi:uncharacterized protein [Aegilops tauschii subsp. strangulata]|uniref:uncharacterized protein n=1 Tax=Aegilops tauschii subsp. strangulata TaxID=200361 RepID=UPI00098AF0E8|nr:uncharacterized protein LOC109745654 [Aegilops tauschii subsp. strangulata]
MVLDSTFSIERRTCRFSQILIDGGSSINILYRDTMEELGIKEKQLQPSRTVFHGIVPRISCFAIGKIKIDVLFGDKTHFRREPIWFEVVDLDNPYHALLDEMAGPKCFITIAGDYQKSLTCTTASSRLAESLIIAEGKRLLDRALAMASKQPAMPSNPKDADAGGSFQPSKETKKIILDPAHPEQHAVIGSNLDSK